MKGSQKVIDALNEALHEELTAIRTMRRASFSSGCSRTKKSTSIGSKRKSTR